MATEDKYEATRRRHRDALGWELKAAEVVDRIAVLFVPTAKLFALWALVRLADVLFGVRVESPRIAAALAVLLWCWWALKRFAAPPLYSIAEVHQKRVRAREADERGHCRDARCRMCGGKPPPADALERWERERASTGGA